MAQPSKRILLKLPHPFPADTQLLSQLLQRARWLVTQSIPAHYHPAKALRKLTHQVEQNTCHEFPL
jgi:hypothetical protein